MRTGEDEGSGKLVHISEVTNYQEHVNQALDPWTQCNAIFHRSNTIFDPTFNSILEFPDRNLIHILPGIGLFNTHSVDVGYRMYVHVCTLYSVHTCTL